LGPGDSQERVLHRIREQSSFLLRNCGNNTSQASSADHFAGGTDTVGKGGHCEGSFSRHRRVLFNSVCSSKEVWGSQTHSKHKAFEQVYQDPAFQDGYPEAGQVKPVQGVLVGILRSEGCLSAHPYKQKSPKVPQVQSAGRHVPVEVSSIRTGHSTQGIYQDSSGVGGHPEKGGHSPICLPGRYSDSSRVQSSVKSGCVEGVRPLHDGRVFSELSQVRTKPFTRFVLHRGKVKDRPRHSSVARGKSKGPGDMSQGFQGRGISASQNVSPPLRSHGSHHRGGTVCKATNEACTVFLDAPMVATQESTGYANSGFARFVSASPVVEGSFESVQGLPHETVHSAEGGHHRCIYEWLGRCAGRQVHCPRHVGTVPDTLAYKQTRDESSLVDSATVRVSCQGPGGSDQVGLNHSGHLYKQTRRDKVSSTVSTGLGAMDLVCSQGHSPGSGSPTRGKELSGRSPVQTGSRSQGMGPEQSGVQSAFQEVGPSHGGLVCHQQEQEATSVLYMEDGTRGSGSQCNGAGLEPGSGVCLSSFSPHSSDSGEGKGRSGHGDFDSTLVAQEDLVSIPTGNVGGSASQVESRPRPIVPGSSRLPDLSSRSRVVEVSGLEDKRRGLQDQGLSQAIVTTILAAKSQSTNATYDSSWRCFVGWCCEREISPYTASVPVVLKYLQSLLDSGRAANTIKVHLAAIKTYVKSRTPFESNALLSQFLKGVFNIKPPVKDPFPTWDLHLVLEALREYPYEPIEETSLQNLTMKTAFLVAITSARRGCELQALDVRQDWCRIGPGGATLRHNPSFITKVRREEYINAQIRLPVLFPQPQNRLEEEFHRLCVCRSLRAYIKATQALRKPGSTQLFVTFGDSNKGSPASVATISRWVVSVVRRAYIHMGRDMPERLRAHSTRGVSSSVAYQQGVDVGEICRAAMWSNTTSFVKHYKLNVSGAREGAIGTAVFAHHLASR